MKLLFSATVLASMAIASSAWAVCGVTSVQVKDNTGATAQYTALNDGTNCAGETGLIVGGALVAVGNGLPVTSATGASFAVTNAGTFAVQATQAGTWNLNNISGTVSLPTGAATAAKQPAIGTAGASSADVLSVQGIASGTALTISGTVTANAGTNLNTSTLATSANQPTNAAQASTTSGQTGNLMQGAVTTAAPTYTTAQTDPLSLTTAGALRVDGSGATQPVSGTVTANAGTNLNTSALATSANQTNASQKTQIVDGSGNVIASTSNNLNVQCANCSGSGASGTDEGAFTAGSSVFAPTGGFFQTTATNNALTTGQWGLFQSTANRALFTNLRNASGTEVGTASTPLQVSLANTGANGTAVSVSLAANQSVNEAQINGVTPLMNNGVSGTGSQRINIASDNSAVSGLGAGATGSAVPANAVLVGGNGSGNLTAPVVCDNWTPINNAGASTALKLITKAASKQVYICSINLVAAAANNVALVEGTQTTNQCDTSTAGMAGGATAATGWNLAANGGLTFGSGLGAVIRTATVNHDVCLLFSAANQVSGSVSWTQF